VESKSGKRFKLFNPATEELVAEVCEAGAEDVDIAVCPELLKDLSHKVA
jgi:aldehyde dehydrogenase (NAD+)